MDTNPRKLRAYCFIWLILCVLVLIVCVILSRAEEKDGNDDDHVPRIYSVLVEGEPLAFHAATNINSKAMAYEANKIEETHEEILGSTLEKGSYTKLYSFKHIINALAVRTTPSQVLLLPTKMKNKFTFAGLV
ncbi:BnaAnng20560D [Brassica napus]|uniref:BnaAnng20560D protein n=1 Tax=Brassica napus TaxID=3708 RepID=A0A078JG88_BRANA|nr:BnaAnng20560D [Brassica napus]